MPLGYFRRIEGTKLAYKTTYVDRVFEYFFRCFRKIAKIEYYVSNVVCFLLGNSPASEFYMPTFRNACLFHLHRQEDMKNEFEKCWGLMFIGPCIILIVE